MTEDKFENSPKTGEEINRAFKIQKNQGWQRVTSALAAEICAGPHNRLLRRQHCSSLCSQSEGHEHVANMTSAFGHDFVGFSARAWPPQYSSLSLCEQSELQCFAPGLRQMSGSLAERRLRRWLSEFVFLPLCLAGVSASLVEKTETNTIR